MNRKLSDCIGYTIHALDGDAGTVERFYFDDLTWTLRYVAVETGEKPNRQVLLPMAALGTPAWEQRVFPVTLTREQVRRSPLINTQSPVSLHEEIELIELRDQLTWPMYWSGGFYMLPRFGLVPASAFDAEPPAEVSPAGVCKLDPHLRSILEVVDCQVQATDGHIGHVEEVLVADEVWAIRYLVVNTRDWLPGRRVLVSPQWITQANWADRKVFVDLTREAIKKSPKYTPSKALTTAYEHKLFDHLQKGAVKDWVIFKVHAPAGADVHVAGTFNDWNPTSLKLHPCGNGVYSAMILLPVGRYEFKFIVNGEWTNGKDQGEKVPNSYGTTNNVLMVHHVVARDAQLHTFDRQPDREERVILGTWQDD